MADKSIYLSEFKFNLVMRENMVRTHNKTWPNGFEMIVAKRWAKYLFYYVVHSWLRTLSNHVFKSQIKFYPIFLLAENRELNEMMVVALRKPFQSYQYSTGIYLT